MSAVEPPVGPGPAAIDPRIRARRIEVARSAGRRRLQRLAEAGAVAVVAAVFVGALYTPLLDVEQVPVTGVEHLSADAVRRAAAISVGDPLVSVDLGAAGARVAALPWVAEAALHRRLDGTVDVAVTERTAVATAATPSGAVLLDVEGRVLGPVAEAPEAAAGLPAVGGLGEVPAPGGFVAEAAAGALVVAQRVAALAPGAVTAVEVEDLVATLAQGGAVRLGDTAQLDAKLRSLQTVLDQVDLTCLAVIDLRLPGSPVLTREEGCS